jgi:hypothetical protein
LLLRCATTWTLPHLTAMADDGAPSAAPQRLAELLVRADVLAGKSRFETAVAKLEEAVVLARTTMPPHSLLRAYALVRHADCTIAQQRQLFSRSDTGSGVERATYAAEQALCAAAYASLHEALPILFARAEANTLLPGRVPADEEESSMRLIALQERTRRKGDDSAAAVAARIADAHARRHGQSLGYQVYLEAAVFSFFALCPALYNTPFPPLNMDDDHARQEVDTMCICIINAVRWLGASDGAPDAATNGVQWQLGGLNGLLEQNKLCNVVSCFLLVTQAGALGLARPMNDFRRMLDELWHSPQLASRRLRWAETSPIQWQLDSESRQRAAADVARLGLAKCARADCGAVESCPKAFKTCARCHSVVYCGRDCQLVAWPSHKRECKRLAAERDADANA